MDHQQCCGCPPGKKTKTVPEESAGGHHSLSPDSPAHAEDLQDTDSEEDYGEVEWDPHAGTKPSPLDGEASDELWDSEDDFEEVKSEAVNALMVKMLQDDDEEWKPKHKRKKERVKNG